MEATSYIAVRNHLFIFVTYAEELCACLNDVNDAILSLLATHYCGDEQSSKGAPNRAKRALDVEKVTY